MLKKENRLKNSKAFTATYGAGNSVSDNLLILHGGHIKKETQKDFPLRVGFVVSKKIHKRAVVRNKIKRLMRECVRLCFKNNNLYGANNFLSLIFTAKINSVDKNYEEIYSSVTKLMKKLATKNF